jgi:hypothetical protein
MRKRSVLLFPSSTIINHRGEANMATLTINITSQEQDLLTTALQSHKDYLEQFALEFMNSDNADTRKEAEKLRREFFESTLLWKKILHANGKEGK